MLVSMAQEEMRAGDSDRQAVADRLRTALDEGRLDLTEYDQRLQKTYNAKTFGDLSGLLDDLPGTVPAADSKVQPYQAPPVPAYQAPEPAQPVEQQSKASQIASWVGPYGGVVAVCIVIWAITSFSSGHVTYFWPVWMLIPLIFGFFGSKQSGRDRDRRRKRDR